MSMIGSKVKARRHTADDGEGWLVSYADMVTLLLGFFVVLYSFSEINEKKLDSVGREMAEALGAMGLKQDPGDSDDMSTERMIRALQMMIAILNLGQSTEEGVKEIENIAREVAASKDRLDQIKDKLRKSENASLLLTPGGQGEEFKKVTIALPSKFLFKSGGSELLPEAKVKLKEVAAALSGPADHSLIDVVGHTDSQPLISKTYRDNWDLSAARAAEVAKQLLANGVPKGRIQIIGKADQFPLFPEKNAQGSYIEENLIRNRRVEIVIHRTVTP